MPRPTVHPRALVLATLALAGLVAAQTVTATASTTVVVGPPKEIKPGEFGSRLFKLDHESPQGAVVDGDTLRLRDPESKDEVRVRLLAVDTEEMLWDERDEKAARADFAAYSRQRQGDSKVPTKYGTPMGLATRAYAQEFFKGVEDVLLLPEDPSDGVDYYDRLLGHLFVDRDADGDFEDHYDLKLVENGYSPYFIKYGRSRLYDEDLKAAEASARAKKLGIWNDKPAAGQEHYPDYDLRLEWWQRRADAIATYAAKHAQDPSFVRTGVDAEGKRLAGLVGKRVTVFGSFYEFTPRDGAARSATDPRGFISHRQKADIPVFTTDDALWEKLAVPGFEHELFYLNGRLEAHEGKAGVALILDGESKAYVEGDR